jgi:hypothetical protein
VEDVEGDRGEGSEAPTGSEVMGNGRGGERESYFRELRGLDIFGRESTTGTGVGATG